MQIIDPGSTPEMRIRQEEIEAYDIELLNQHPSAIAIIREPFPLEQEIAAQTGEKLTRVEIARNPLGIGTPFIKHTVTDGHVHDGPPRIIYAKQGKAKRRSKKKGFWEL